MSFFRKIGNGMARFMYGRNGLERLGIAQIWVCLILEVVSMIVSRRVPAAGSVLYLISTALWIWAIFRMFSRNLYKRREENARYCALFGGLRARSDGAKARHADREHRYFTCKQCKTICRVPVGKGKIVITCPKCGAEIHAKT